MLGLHWLQGSLPVSFLPDVFRRIGEDLNVEPVECRPFLRYARAARFGVGCRVLWSDGVNGESPRPDVCLAFTGQGCDEWKLESLYEFCFYLRGLSSDGCKGFHCTRVDVAFDDHQKRITPAEVWEFHAKPGNYSGPKSLRHVEGGRRSKDGDLGEGVYFGEPGSIGSGVQFVVYRKDVESEGEIDATRFEARYWQKDDKAQKAFEHVTNCGLSCAQFVRKMGSLITGPCTFYDDTSEKNRDRRPVAGWWQSIVTQLGDGVRFRGEVKERAGMQDLLDNFAVRCAPAFYTICEHFKNKGDRVAYNRYFLDVAERGRKRVKPDMLALAGVPVPAMRVQFEQAELPF